MRYAKKDVALSIRCVSTSSVSSIWRGGGATRKKRRARECNGEKGVKRSYQISQI